jgi:hypothetical protein
MTVKLRRGRPRLEHPSQVNGRVFVGAQIPADVRDQSYELVDRLVARFPGLSMTAIVRLGVLSVVRDLEAIDAAIHAEHADTVAVADDSADPVSNKAGKEDDL